MQGAGQKVRGYGMAVLVVVVVVGLKIALASLLDHPPFLLFLAAVMVASWFGGLGPGLLATVLAAGTAQWLFLPEEMSPTGQYVALGLFCTEGAVIGGLGAFLQAARRRAEKAELRLRHDLAERLQIEEALRSSQGELREADRRKDQFLGMLSHELRNPLAALANAIAVVRRGTRTDEALALAERQVQRLGRMVEDLLDVSRTTSGKVVLRREPIELGAVVESAVQVARPLLVARRHRLTVTLPPEPVTLLGDRVRLEQVLGNLLDNAAKYTDEEGEILVHAERAGDEVVLHVRDTGIGLGPEELPRLFDVFVQGERSLDRAGGGLGIGLSVVRSLIELHGGRVEVRSAGHGCGSEFVVHLPVLGPAAAAERSAEPPVPPSGAANRRLLIVDDNADVLESMTLALAGLGYEVRGCSSGPVALEIASRDPPDVVLLDIGLPGMDGYEIARCLRRQMGLHCPILVALSGYGRDEDRKRSREVGFEAYLTKPIDPDVLHGLLVDITAPPPPARGHAGAPRAG